MHDKNFKTGQEVLEEKISTRICKYCEGKIPLDALKCMHCGEWVEKEKNNVPNEISTKFCPYCDSEIHLKAVKCKHCGEWVEKKTNLSKIATETTESTLVSEALKEGIRHLKDIWR